MVTHFCGMPDLPNDTLTRLTADLERFYQKAQRLEWEVREAVAELKRLVVDGRDVGAEAKKAEAA
jgi:hypothetical protein